MGIPGYSEGQEKLMEASVGILDRIERELPDVEQQTDALMAYYELELELGRGDEPLIPDLYRPGTFAGLRPWEPLPQAPKPADEPLGMPPIGILVAEELQGVPYDNLVNLILTPWVEEGPDYLAITRDVAGG